MAKMIVKFDQSYGDHLIMDSKDFATVAEIFARSKQVRVEYNEGEYYNIETDMKDLSAKLLLNPVFTQEEYESFKTTKQEQ